MGAFEQGQDRDAIKPSDVTGRAGVGPGPRPLASQTLNRMHLGRRILPMCRDFLRSERGTRLASTDFWPNDRLPLVNRGTLAYGSLRRQLKLGCKQKWSLRRVVRRRDVKRGFGKESCEVIENKVGQARPFSRLSRKQK